LTLSHDFSIPEDIISAMEPAEVAQAEEWLMETKRRSASGTAPFTIRTAAQTLNTIEAQLRLIGAEGDRDGVRQAAQRVGLVGQINRVLTLLYGPETRVVTRIRAPARRPGRRLEEEHATP
jgi:hypothetical protein